MRALLAIRHLAALCELGREKQRCERKGRATTGAWTMSDTPIMNANCIPCFSMDKSAILGSSSLRGWSEGKNHCLLVLEKAQRALNGIRRIPPAGAGRLHTQVTMAGVSTFVPRLFLCESTWRGEGARRNGKLPVTRSLFPLVHISAGLCYPELRS